MFALVFLLISEPDSCARTPPPPATASESRASERTPFLSEEDPTSNNLQKEDKRGATTARHPRSGSTTGIGHRNPLVWRRRPPKNIPTVLAFRIAPNICWRKRLGNKLPTEAFGEEISDRGRQVLPQTLSQTYVWCYPKRQHSGSILRRPSSSHQWVAMSNPCGATRPRMASGGSSAFVFLLVIVGGRVFFGQKNGLAR